MPEKQPQTTARILGGQFANLGEIPWHLLIKEPSRAGASLINDRWAVTAAHVVDQVEETSLRLYGGLVDGRAASTEPKFSDNKNVVVIESEKIIIHPGYERNVRDRTNFDNDIALIRFSARVDLGPNLIPICLPEGNVAMLENEQGTVSGWGVTERGVSAKLKYTSMGVYSLKECQNTPNLSPNKPMAFTDNMFCAGAEGKDSCEKDSGGPFVLPTLTASSGPFRLIGIVSWGSPCRQRRFKGYYTKVEKYAHWIKNTIDATERSLRGGK